MREEKEEVPQVVVTMLEEIKLKRSLNENLSSSATEKKKKPTKLIRSEKKKKSSKCK